MKRGHHRCLRSLRIEVRRRGFAFVTFRFFDVGIQGREGRMFVGAWNRLPADAWMRDGGGYRFRRYGRFEFCRARGKLRRLQHRAFWQDAKLNWFAGGMSRVFAPIENDVARSRILNALVERSYEVFCRGMGVNNVGWWEVHAHQIRVEAFGDLQSAVAPEGIHRDGHTFLSIHLIRRENITGGRSVVCNEGGSIVGERMLKVPLDSLFLDDRRMFHGGTAISRCCSLNRGWRDVLLLDFDFRRISLGRRAVEY